MTVTSPLLTLWSATNRVNQIYDNLAVWKDEGVNVSGKAIQGGHNLQETDRYWNAIVGNGGQESACGWCKDRWGLSWQITPRTLTDALAAGGAEASRAFEAMMSMKKIDVATIEAARRG